MVQLDDMPLYGLYNHALGFSVNRPIASLAARATALLLIALALMALNLVLQRRRAMAAPARG